MSSETKCYNKNNPTYQITFTKFWWNTYNASLNRLPQIPYKVFNLAAFSLDPTDDRSFGVARSKKSVKKIQETAKIQVIQKITKLKQKIISLYRVDEVVVSKTKLLSLLLSFLLLLRPRVFVRIVLCLFVCTFWSLVRFSFVCV